MISEIKIKAFDELIDEFTHIKVEIETGNQSFIEGSIEQYDDEGNLEYRVHYDFYIKFQNEKKVHCFTILDIGDDYLKKLDKFRINFYKNISSVISNSTNNLYLSNILNDYQIRFSELLSDYSECQHNLSEQIITLKDHKKIDYYFVDQKPIYDFDRARILHYFLLAQIETIEKILNYLDKKIDLLKLQLSNRIHESLSSATKKKLNKLYHEKKSFELNPDLLRPEPGSDLKTKEVKDRIIAEKLKNFKDALIKGGYIIPIDFRFFIHAFKNQDIIQPIVWKKTPNELCYLIKCLYDQNLIIRFKYYWIVACKCFLAYDNRTRVCTAKYLQRCKPKITKTDIKIFNSILVTLS